MSPTETAIGVWTPREKIKLEYFTTDGYAYSGSPDGSPAATADLIHVKIRKKHSHTLKYTPSFAPSFVPPVNDGLPNHVLAVNVSWGFNAWYDPAKVSSVQITLSDKQPITVKLDGQPHCFYEDKHGELKAATDRPCNAN